MVAAAAAVALHALATLWLSGGGWAGSGESAPALAQRGGASPSTTHGGLRVRLASSVVATSTNASEASGSNQALAAVDLDRIASEPPAAGGETPFASTYVPAEELDQGPAPEPGWILDEAALEQVGRASLRLRLWVSEKGRIDRVAVLHAEPPGDWVDHALRPLPSTPMRPAERDGRAVASTTVVELTANLETMR